jgi:hypothetical protein
MAGVAEVITAAVGCPLVQPATVTPTSAQVSAGRTNRKAVIWSG